MNCPINIDNIKRSIHIYGLDVAGIKEKTTRRKPKPLEMVGNIPLPPSVLKHHRNIMVSGDYVYVHTLSHLHTISRGYGFRTVEYTPGKKANKGQIKKGVNRVLRLYRKQGINVQQLNADNEFECIRDDILPVNLNVVAAGEHVGDIER